MVGKGGVSRASSIDVVDLIDRGVRGSASHGEGEGGDVRARHRTSPSVGYLLSVFGGSGGHRV